MSLSRKALFVCALPSVLMVLLFYSLALHMFRQLGGWPTSIGELGFPPLLVAHAYLATGYFYMFFMINALLLPIALIFFLVVRDLRRGVVYLGAYVLFYALALGLMLLAPPQFKYWWMD